MCQSASEAATLQLECAIERYARRAARAVDLHHGPFHARDPAVRRAAAMRAGVASWSTCARFRARGAIRSSTKMSWARNSRHTRSAIRASPVSAACAAARTRCRAQPTLIGKMRAFTIMPITLCRMSSARRWLNCWRSARRGAARSCARRRCGGAATAASSPITCWRETRRCFTSWAATASRRRGLTPGRPSQRWEGHISRRRLSERIGSKAALGFNGLPSVRTGLSCWRVERGERLRGATDRGNQICR